MFEKGHKKESVEKFKAEVIGRIAMIFYLVIIRIN